LLRLLCLIDEGGWIELAAAIDGAALRHLHALGLVEVRYSLGYTFFHRQARLTERGRAAC
jgi:hypothetical protein